MIMQGGYGGRFGMRWILVLSFVCAGFLGVVHHGYAESRTTDFSCPEDTSPVPNKGFGGACYEIAVVELEHYLSRRADPNQPRLNGLNREDVMARISRPDRSVQNVLHSLKVKARVVHLDPTPEVKICNGTKTEIRLGDPCLVMLAAGRDLHAVVAFAYDESDWGLGMYSVFSVADSNPASEDPQEQREREAQRLVYDHTANAWSYNHPGWNAEPLYVAYVPLKQFPDYVPPPWQRPGSHCGQEVIAPDGSMMVWVPSGRFTMGVTRQEIDRLWAQNGWDESWKRLFSKAPPHPIELDGFWIGKYEVTNQQYATFLNTRGVQGELKGLWIPRLDCPGCEIDYRDGCYRAKMGREGHPVHHVTWHGANAYCGYYALELSTEAQWEYAARGPRGRLYPWGNRWDRTICNSAEYWARRPINSDAVWRTWARSIGWKRKSDSGDWYIPCPLAANFNTAVGSFPAGASWCGALDLAGNVWEWCGDWYSKDYYHQSSFRNPAGPSTGTERVLRGGSCSNGAYACSGVYRLSRAPERWSTPLGFRVVKSFH